MDSVLEREAPERKNDDHGANGRCSRRRRLLAAVVALPVVAIATTYAVFFTPDSPAELQLSSQAADTAVAVPSGMWSVGEGSVAGYRVREKLLRLPASNDGVGRTSAITGAFRLSGDRSGMRVERGLRLDVDVSTLKSDDDRRDNSMRTVGIETDLYPTATFVSTTDIVLPPGVVSGGQAAVTVEGHLTIHGVTRPVALALQAQHTGGRIEVVGTYTFGWDQFEMKQPNKTYVTVESDPTLEFQVYFDHESAKPAF